MTDRHTVASADRRFAAVRTGSHVADASALPTPTADLLGAQYLLTGGVDGLGLPLLATCVTDDGVAYSWGLVPFGADVAGLRDALDTYSTAETDAADAATLAAAQTYADNTLQGFASKGTARAVLAQTSLATLLGGCTYDGGTKRLTASGNGAIGTVDGVTDLAVDDLVGVPLLTSTDARYNGPWRIVQIGSVSTPVILVRPTNFDTSSDVKAGSYYLVEDGTEYGGSLYQLTTEGPYTLDTTALTWVRRRINLSLSDTTPAALGSAAPGTSSEASRRDHAHAMPSAADVGAPALSTLTTNDDIYMRLAGVVTRFATSTVGKLLMAAASEAAARAAIGAPALSRLYLPATPVLRWPCSETSGTTLANLGSFSGGDLTITGSPDLGVPTEIGSAIRWTGSAAGSPTTEYAKGASGVTNPASALTVLSWLKLRAYPQPYGKIAFWTSRSTWGAGGIEGVGLRLAGGAEAGMGAGGWRAMIVTGTAGSGTQTSLDATNASAHRRLSLGVLYLLAMTYDGTWLRAYLDGFLVASVAVSGTIDYGSTGTRYWMLGNNAATGIASECIDALQREVQVYSTALSAADLRTIYETGRGLL